MKMAMFGNRNKFPDYDPNFELDDGKKLFRKGKGIPEKDIINYHDVVRIIEKHRSCKMINTDLERALNKIRQDLKNLKNKA